MPGMTGLEMLPKVKELRPDVPVIMITAYGDPETRRKALDGGATGLLTKPIDFTLLREEIDTRLAQAEERLRWRKAAQGSKKARGSFSALIMASTMSAAGIVLGVLPAAPTSRADWRASAPSARGSAFDQGARDAERDRLGAHLGLFYGGFRSRGSPDVVRDRSMWRRD